MTIADYSWWRAWRPDWADAHCVTLVSDVTPTALVDALGASRVTEVRGIDAFGRCATDHWADGYDPSRALIGVTDAGGGWALMVEINGYVGVTEALTGRVASGRTVVSHFRNVNAVHRFHWWRDGRLLVDLDLLFPAERFGTDPDAVLDDLRAVGVPVDADVADVDLGAAGFALAQRLTGVTCTAEAFEQSDFVVAVVAIPADDPV